MPDTTSLVSLVRSLANRFYGGSGRMPLVLGTSDALGSSTTLEDTAALAYASADSDLLTGLFLRIDELVASGPASGEIGRINAGGFAAATGVITISPALTNPIQTGTDYSLHILNPLLLREAINWALPQMKHLTYGPLSLLVDADMEASGITDWPETGSGTRSKITTAARVHSGAQSLRLANGAANDYVSNLTAVPVLENEPYFLSAIAQADVGTARLLARRLTATAADIDSVDTDDEKLIELRLLFDIPAGAEEIEIRLQGVESNADCYWDDVILLMRGQSLYDLPSYVEDPEDLVSVGYWPRGVGPTDDTFRLNEKGWVDWPWWRVWRADEAANPYKLELSTPIQERIYLIAWTRFPTLTSDAATTVADETAVLAGARTYVRKMLADGAIFIDDESITGVLKAMQAEDDRIWAKAIRGSGGGPRTRMIGLRKYAAH